MTIFQENNSHNSEKLLQTGKPNIQKFSWESGLHLWILSYRLKMSTTGSKRRFLSTTRSKNQGMSQTLQCNFLLKRKLSRGVYIKVVALISSFSASDQLSLNSIPKKRYGQNTKRNWWVPF